MGRFAPRVKNWPSSSLTPPFFTTAYAVGSQRKGAPYLFPNEQGQSLHGTNLTGEFHSVCNAAGVPRIPFHAARHGCGTLLNAGDADAFTIREVLGHSQLFTTRRYTHVSVSVTNTALEDLEPLPAMPGKAVPATRPASKRVQ